MRAHDGAGVFVDADLRDRRAVRRHVRPEADAFADDDAIACASVGQRSWLPVRRFRDGIEHGEPAGIGHVAAAELDGIDARHVRELVERLLRRKRKRHVERRAQVRRLEIAGDARHAMVVQTQIRNVVHRAERHLIEVARRAVRRLVGRRAEVAARRTLLIAQPKARADGRRVGLDVVRRMDAIQQDPVEPAARAVAGGQERSAVRTGSDVTNFFVIVLLAELAS